MAGATDGEGRVDFSKLKRALIRFGVDPKDVRQLHAMGFTQHILMKRLPIEANGWGKHSLQ